MPKPCKEGQVTTAEGAGQIASEIRDITQVIDEKLPLSLSVGGVCVDVGGFLAQAFGNLVERLHAVVIIESRPVEVRIGADQHKCVAWSA